jgi:hypothetical protein
MLRHSINISVETMSFYKTYGEKHKMLLEKVLERLSEMFPTQQYQSRLEQYINSKNPTNAAEVDFWQREYETRNTQYWSRGL